MKEEEGKGWREPLGTRRRRGRGSRPDLCRSRTAPRRFRGGGGRQGEPPPLVAPPARLVTLPDRGLCV